MFAFFRHMVQNYFPDSGVCKMQRTAKANKQASSST